MRATGLVLFMLLVLCACSAEAAPVMYLQPAELTEEEKALVQLLGADTDQYLLDVVLDETAEKLHVSYYELVDGKWEPFSGGSMRLDAEDTVGRLAFDFDSLQEGQREAVQFGKDFSAITRAFPEEEKGKLDHLGRGTTYVSSRREIVYETEIPLAIQFYSSSDTVRSIDLEEFFEPESLEDLGYEHVYALTVTFSREPLS